MSAGKQSKNEREREAFNQRAAAVSARCARANFISRSELPPELQDIVLRIAGQVGLDVSAARALVNLTIRHNVKNFLVHLFGDSTLGSLGGGGGIVIVGATGSNKTEMLARSLEAARLAQIVLRTAFKHLVIDYDDEKNERTPRVVHLEGDAAMRARHAELAGALLFDPMLATAATPTSPEALQRSTVQNNANVLHVDEASGMMDALKGSGQVIGGWQSVVQTQLRAAPSWKNETIGRGGVDARAGQE